MSGSHCIGGLPFVLNIKKLCGRVNMANGAVKTVECGLVDEYSPGKYPQFTFIP